MKYYSEQDAVDFAVSLGSTTDVSALETWAASNADDPILDDEVVGDQALKTKVADMIAAKFPGDSLGLVGHAQNVYDWITGTTAGGPVLDNTLVAKVVPDADYTITSEDDFIVLPDPSVPRDINIPAASTMQGQRKHILSRGTTSGDWVFTGSFIQKGGSGALTEDFVNSGMAPGEYFDLVSTEVSTGVWKWVQAG